MIITKEFAEKLDKKTLAELATKYCNEVAEKLGNDKRIEITPQELIYDLKEAETYFCQNFIKPKRSDSEFDHICYKRTKKNIKKSALCMDGIAYTPLVRLSKEERDLVLRILGNKPKNPLRRPIDYLFRGEPYLSLRGFGSEMGHLVGDKLYGQKAYSGGLGELLDYLSILYEISFNIRTICKSADKNCLDQGQLEKELIDKNITQIRRDIEIYEALLFEGETSAKQKLIKQIAHIIETFPFKREISAKQKKLINQAALGITKLIAGKLLNFFKEQYIYAPHFDGAKLFIEIFDRDNCDLDRTYKKVGCLLSNPDVLKAADVLRELGFFNNQVLRYEIIFAASEEERKERLTLYTDVNF